MLTETSVITAEQLAHHKQRYEQDGVTMIPQVLTLEEVARTQQAIDELLAAKDLPAGSGWDYDVAKGRFFMGMFLWTFNERMKATVTQSALPQLAAGMLGSKNINLLFDQLFVKEPGTNNPTPWHQDQPYWPVSGDQVMSFWIALDPVDKASGAVEYVKGSHRWNNRYQPNSFAGPNRYPINQQLETIPDINARRAEFDIVSFDMQPGDVIAFHGCVLHGAGGNTTSNRRRRGYSIRYCGDDVRYAPDVQTFKLIRDPGIAPGARLDSDLFPRLIGA
jgi:ectoine hydroxylase-related dioxygenase (phytanoyl-CoA dioxygenase family)